METWPSASAVASIHFEAQDELEKAVTKSFISNKYPSRPMSPPSAQMHFTNSLNIVDRKQRLSLEIDLRSETRLGNRSSMRSPLASPLEARGQDSSSILSLDTPANGMLDIRSDGSSCWVMSPPLAVVKK